MFECHTLRRGDSTHPKLIFLHGLFGSAQDWEPLIEELSQNYECIAIDLPGHGKTPYREKIINSFREYLKKNKIKPILIGYSMGGRIALQLREHTKGVVAISAHLGLKTEGEKQEQQEKETQWKRKLLTFELEAFLREWYAQPLFDSLSQKPSQLEALIKQRKNQDPTLLAQVLSQLSLANQKAITSFPTPTLLIHGKKDSKYQQLYHNMRLPVCSINQAGHACLIENPKECALVILNWLEKCHANNESRNSGLETCSSLHRH